MLREELKELAKKRKSNKNWEEFFSGIIFAILFLLLFLSPILFFPLAYEWIGIARVTLLRIAASLLLVCWTLKFLFLPYIRRSRFDLPVLLFLFLAFISTIFSIHAPTSLLGGYYRYQGLSTLIIYALLYFLVVQTSTEKRTDLMLNVLIIVGSLVSLYGLVQYLGFDFISWGKERWEVNRSFSTLGNPIFLGGYLSLILPVAISRFLLARRFWVKLFLIASTLLIATAILTTFSRGAWLAAIAGILGFLIFSTRLNGLIKRVFVLILLFSLICVFLFLVGSFWSKSNGGNITFAERISSLSRIREGSLGTRLLIWESTLKVIKERPLLGWGPDTFRLVYPRASSLQEARAEGYLKLSDNAHSYPLQIATTQGALGLWSFLALLVAILWTARDLLRLRETHFLRVSGLFLGIFSYLIYLLSGIMSVEAGALFWMVVGLFASSLPLDANKVSVYQKYKRIKFFSYFMVVVSLLLLLAIFTVSSSLFLADIYFARAINYVKQGLVEDGEDSYFGAMRLNPWLDLYPRHLGRFYARLAVEANSLDFFQAGVAVYLEAERRSPESPDNHGFLGDLYLIGGQLFDKSYFELAEKELKLAVQFYPYWADVHSDLGILYFQTKRYKQAVNEFKWVRDINPSDTKALLYLGRSYRVLGEKKNSLDAYSELLKHDPSHQEAREAIKELSGK